MFFLNIIIHELSSIVDEFVSRFLQFFFTQIHSRSIQIFQITRRNAASATRKTGYVYPATDERISVG